MPEETQVPEDAAKEVKHIDVQKKTEMLKCKLSSEELLDFGDRLANRQQELQEINDELKGIKDNYKAKISAIEADEVRLGNLVRQKYEMRDIECEITFDFDALEVTVKRMDTGEIAKVRPMTDGEKQRELKLFPVAEVKPEDEPNYQPPITNEEIVQAIGILKETKRASQTAIQRRMGIDNPNRAWMILDKLEQLKVVGAPQGDEPREIIMDEVAIERFLDAYPAAPEKKAEEPTADEAPESPDEE